MLRPSYQALPEPPFLAFFNQLFKLCLVGAFFLMSSIPMFANGLQSLNVTPSVIVGNSIETASFSLIVDPSIPGSVVYGEDPSDPINLCVGPGGGGAAGNIITPVQCGVVLQPTTFTFFATQPVLP